VDLQWRWGRECLRVAERGQASESSWKTPCWVAGEYVAANVRPLWLTTGNFQLARSAKLNDRWLDWQWHNALAATWLFEIGGNQAAGSVITAKQKPALDGSSQRHMFGGRGGRADARATALDGGPGGGASSRGATSPFPFSGGGVPRTRLMHASPQATRWAQPAHRLSLAIDSRADCSLALCYSHDAAIHAILTLTSHVTAVGTAISLVVSTWVHCYIAFCPTRLLVSFT
jgi:hypothetical protein